MRPGNPFRCDICGRFIGYEEFSKDNIETYYKPETLTESEEVIHYHKKHSSNNLMILDEWEKIHQNIKNSIILTKLFNKKEKMKTSIGLNDGYATMYTQGSNSWDEDETKLSFYYGYEVTEDNEIDGEWMFVAKQNGIVIKSYTTTEIESHTSDSLREPVGYLLVGINMYLNGV